MSCASRSRKVAVSASLVRRLATSPSRCARSSSCICLTPASLRHLAAVGGVFLKFILVDMAARLRAWVDALCQPIEEGGGVADFLCKSNMTLLQFVIHLLPRWLVHVSPRNLRACALMPPQQFFQRQKISLAE